MTILPIIACGALAFHATPIRTARWIVQEERGFEMTIAELGQLNGAASVTRRFLAAAERADLSAAKSLCNLRPDPNLPTAGYGATAIGFGNSASLRSEWATPRFRLKSVAFLRAKGKVPTYIFAWLRPGKGKWHGDTAIVVRPASGKIVGIIDTSE